MLWGAAAAAAIGAATAYVLEQRRKRKEEEARQAAEAAQKAAQKNAAFEAAKIQNYLQGQAMLNAALQNPNLSAAERAAIQAHARRRGIGAALGLLGGLTAAAAERMRRQQERAEQSAARKEKQLEYEGRKAGEVQLEDVACTPENIQKPKNWWEKVWNWAKSPATWWGAVSEEESIKLMKKARNFPDVSIPLPILKGFGMDDVVGPVKYTVRTNTAIRTFGRILDDFSPGVLTGVGWGITVAPNFIKNLREKNPWNQTLADLMIDTGGFIVSELVGSLAGILAGSATDGNLVAIIGAKITVDALTSIVWDNFVEQYNWQDRLSNWLERRAQSLLQGIANSMQQSMDTEKYPPVPTPPTPQMTGTPTPVGNTPTTVPSSTPVPNVDTPIPPIPTPPLVPRER